MLTPDTIIPSRRNILLRKVPTRQALSESKKRELRDGLRKGRVRFKNANQRLPKITK